MITLNRSQVIGVDFPDEETVQNPAENTGETFNHKK